MGNVDVPMGARGVAVAETTAVGVSAMGSSVTLVATGVALTDAAVVTAASVEASVRGQPVRHSRQSSVARIGDAILA